MPRALLHTPISTSSLYYTTAIVALQVCLRLVLAAKFPGKQQKRIAVCNSTSLTWNFLYATWLSWASLQWIIRYRGIKCHSVYKYVQCLSNNSKGNSDRVIISKFPHHPPTSHSLIEFLNELNPNEIRCWIRCAWSGAGKYLNTYYGTFVWMHCAK